MKTLKKLTTPPNLNSKEFAENKYFYYRWLREEAPVFHGRISVIDAYVLSRYEDCVRVLREPGFVRDRTKATGGSNRFPVPLPISGALMA